jgi:UDP-glucose 4-epimerase
MQNILITGGAGFIGSALINYLQQECQEYNIHVIDDLSFGSQDFIEIPKENFYRLDIRKKSELDIVFGKINPEMVIHLAAIHFIPFCNENPYLASDININGTRNVLDCVRENGRVTKFFFASTAAVYPILDNPIKESDPLGPLDIYGLTKLVGEDLCSKFYLETGITTIVCRFFNAFGPNETNPHLIPEILGQLLDGASELVLGNLEPKRDFIHTLDMARAIKALIDNCNDGIEVFNLGRGNEYSVREIVKAFESALGRSITIVKDPLRMRKSDRMHLVADISKIENYTGWKPEIGIYEGISKLVHEQ